MVHIPCLVLTLCAGHSFPSNRRQAGVLFSKGVVMFKAFLFCLFIVGISCNNNPTQNTATTAEPRGRCRINCVITTTTPYIYTVSYVYNVTEAECKQAAKDKAGSIQDCGCSGNMDSGK
jgi:hypothetical protein